MTSTPHELSRHRALADERRGRVVQELEQSPDGLDAAGLAQRLGLHVNTVRWHLGILADAGVAGSHPQARTTPGRPRILYHIAAGEQPRPRDLYRLLAQVLAGDGALDVLPTPVCFARLAPRPQPILSEEET